MLFRLVKYFGVVFLFSAIFLYNGSKFKSFLTFKVPTIDAINKVNNWNFTGNANGWTATNGSGTNICGDTGTTSETNFPTFAYSASVGASAFAGTGGTTGNADYRGKITQLLVIPGTGQVKLKGQFDYYANSSKNFSTSWIRLDLYNSADTVFIANIACVSFSSSTSWTTIPWSSDIGVSGGSSYTLRATLKLKNRSNSVAAVTVAIDNIKINLAPTGLNAESLDNSTNITLNWTQSIGGTYALGLNTSTPYKIYRNTSSPADIFLGNGTTNTYTDTTTAGNTVYYYAVSDIDDSSVESPLSSEVNIKTKPGPPTDLVFSNIQNNSLNIGWSAPTGGADSYKIERCLGAGCNDFSSIASGITDPTYDDSNNLQPATVYRYRLLATNSTGDGIYSDIGQVTTSALISISLMSDGAVDFNHLELGTSKNTSVSGTNDPQYVKVDSGPADLTVKSTNFTDASSNIWFINTDNGITQVQWDFSTDGIGWTTFAEANTLYSLASSVGTGDTRPLFLQISMPVSTVTFTQYASTVTIVAAAPP